MEILNSISRLVFTFVIFGRFLVIDATIRVDAWAKVADVNLVVEIPEEWETNFRGVKSFIPSLEQSLRQSGYSITLFVTIHVYGCGDRQSLRFSNMSMVNSALDAVITMNHHTNCDPVPAVFGDPNQFTFAPRTRILLRPVPDNTANWFANAQSIAKNRTDKNYPNYTTQIFIAANDLDDPSSVQSLRIVVYRPYELFPNPVWVVNSSTVANMWTQELPGKIRSAFQEHMKMCQYVFDKGEQCSYNENGTCGLYKVYRSNGSNVEEFCRRRTEFSQPCIFNNPTENKAQCARACRDKTSWTLCNSTECGQIGYRYVFVDGLDPFYSHCPNRTNPTVERCVDECAKGMAAWEIAVIVILTIIGAITILILIYFCVIKPRREAKQGEKVASGPTPAEPGTGSTKGESAKG